MNRLFVDTLRSIGLVKAGDNPEAVVQIWKAKVDKREYSREQREDLARRGLALPDGSFPIVTTTDLRNAVQAFGRASNKAAARQHIMRRAKALGATEMLPEEWMMAKVLSSAESAPETRGTNMGDIDLSAITDEELRKSVEAAFAERDQTISDLTEKVEELTPPKAPEEVAKDAPEEVQAIIKEQAEELRKVRDDLAKERAHRRQAEYVEKARPFAGLLGKAEEVGPIFDTLEDAAPEAFGKLYGMLTAAAQKSALSELFKTLGAGEGEGESDPMAARDAYVAKIQADGDTRPAEVIAAEFWKTQKGRELAKEMRS